MHLRFALGGGSRCSLLLSLCSSACWWAWPRGSRSCVSASKTPWGVAAAVLNLVPYVGSLVMAAAAMLVALMQFGSLDMALVVGGIRLTIRAVSGYVLAPWLTSRTSRLSPVAVFVAVLVWGWLWGVWGMLLGVPIIMVVKATCDRVEGFRPLGELLGP